MVSHSSVITVPTKRIFAIINLLPSTYCFNDLFLFFSMSIPAESKNKSSKRTANPKSENCKNSVSRGRSGSVADYREYRVNVASGFYGRSENYDYPTNTRMGFPGPFLKLVLIDRSLTANASQIFQILPLFQNKRRGRFGSQNVQEWLI